MRVKRYVVDTMPDAMHSIRSELGSDAVILSTKEVKVGGFMGMFTKKKIEVVAAVENTQKPAVPEKAPAQPMNIPRSAVPQAYQKAALASAPQAGPVKETTSARSFAEIAAALSDPGDQGGGGVAVLPALSKTEEPDITAVEPAKEPQPVPNPEESRRALSAIYDSLAAEEPAPGGVPAQESDVLREIRDMKHWMERIARYSSGAAELPDALEVLKGRLIDQETDAVLVDEWIGNVLERYRGEGSGWSSDRFGEALEEQIGEFLAGRIGKGIAPDTKIVYIAGPTGVGKTTTIAKLAAEQLFKQGRKVGLITSDTYRISAVEQLRTYASILNMPLEVVQSPGDLQRAMFRLEGCDLVLMDTAGRNYRNEMLVAELQSLLAKELKSETFLVLSLTSKSRDMKKIAEHFGRYPLDKVIFTKLDETGSYGPLFNVLNDFPLKLSYITNGQNVPDDLLMATREQITGMLLGTGGE
ncbi:flagellar biosynthesis protein FlhF [Paenibacillus sp. LMG 31459]|uniref:Flagellar biosynthesis protein FlhF n=1 Tax=Paenibacillus phytohabitans TaxID=2654978 RepID=A0ABX1YAE4_9BACL|nr:flagellar biosynthesis protein FlhF [Paenibacillus phytohabitans]NOU77912.1 flagellar biosynthesis protein FlhF [Paenibacillus phytohabitans]